MSFLQFTDSIQFKCILFQLLLSHTTFIWIMKKLVLIKHDTCTYEKVLSKNWNKHKILDLKKCITNFNDASLKKWWYIRLCWHLVPPLCVWFYCITCFFLPLEPQKQMTNIVHLYMNSSLCELIPIPKPFETYFFN